MVLLTISTLLALSQAQQPDWCLDAETGTMMCLSGSTLHQKAMDAYSQCSNLGDYGSDMAGGRSIFAAAAEQKRNVEERQAGQCPPVSEMGIAVNNTRQRWDNCRSTVGISSFYMSLASECADFYTEDELKALKFYGARNDAYICLSYHLPAACNNAFYTAAYTSAWTSPDQGNGSGSGIISV